MSRDQSRVRGLLEGVKAAGRTVLTPPEARDICEAYGLPVPKEGIAKSVEEAVRLARDIGFPVALKIVSPDILHKTEAGGVVLPASPGFYNSARSIDDLVNFVVARVCDQLSVEHTLAKRWGAM
jgi:acyl-CoA synthetase (NDP forming)